MTLDIPLKRFSQVFSRVFYIFTGFSRLKILVVLVSCEIILTVVASVLWVAVGFHVGLQDGEFIIGPWCDVGLTTMTNNG